MRRFITIPRVFAACFSTITAALVCMTGLPCADDYRGKWRGHGNLGLAYQHQGRLVEAKEQYQIAIAKNPSFAQAYLNLGTVLQIENRYLDAEAVYLRAAECDPNLPAIYHDLGSLYVQMGRFEEAVTEFHKSISLGGYIAESHNNAGYALANIGKHDEAIREFKAALVANPQYWQAAANIKKLQNL
ncbi:MAG: tetratricopeptide repeat protein [Patescibacteria group bacterium]